MQNLQGEKSAENIDALASFGCELGNLNAHWAANFRGLTGKRGQPLKYRTGGIDQSTKSGGGRSTSRRLWAARLPNGSCGSPGSNWARQISVSALAIQRVLSIHRSCPLFRRALSKSELRRSKAWFPCHIMVGIKNPITDFPRGTGIWLFSPPILK